MLDPIVRTIEVPCGHEEAFRILVAENSAPQAVVDGISRLIGSGRYSLLTE